MDWIERKRWLTAYGRHILNAVQRDVDFQLTFEQWLKLWVDSGHLYERGPRRGQYVMARTGDVGPYAIGNVRIATVTENHEELTHSFEEVARIRQRMYGNTLGVGQPGPWKGKKLPVEVRAKMSVVKLGNKIMVGRKLSEKTKAKMCTAQKLRRLREGGCSEETRARMRASWKLRIAARNSTRAENLQCLKL